MGDDTMDRDEGQVEALPVLTALPPDGAEQVRQWLLRVAEKVAAASKDKGGSEKVTEAEAGAIVDLRILLGSGRTG